jgi:hypothetical protein
MPLPSRPRPALRRSGRALSEQSARARLRVIIRRHCGYALGASAPRRPEFLRGRAWGLWFLMRSFER